MKFVSDLEISSYSFINHSRSFKRSVTCSVYYGRRSDFLNDIVKSFLGLLNCQVVFVTFKCDNMLKDLS